MKSKKRHHHTSSEESEESELTFKTSSSSGSDSDGSSESEHKHKKKRKRAESSDSDSESDDQKRAKKRKHKKKKKKHTKRKRRSDSGDVEGPSEGGEISSISEGEITSKKKRKHKHKHSKRARNSSASEIGEEHVQRRIHSVVKERRGSSEEPNNPPRTYYQKEYRRSESVDYEREREVQRFYRGSSKDRRQAHYERNVPYFPNREINDRYTSYQQDKYDKGRERYGQNSQYNVPAEDHDRRPRDYNEYKRNPRYEEHRPPDEEFQRRPREDTNHSRQDTRVFNKYNFYEERGQKRRDYTENRDPRERRDPPEIDRIQNREYQEKKERFREEPYTSERARDVRRDKPPIRQEKPNTSQHGNPPRPRSPDDRYRDRNRRPQQEPRDVRDERYRDGRGEERREQPGRNEERKPDRTRDNRGDPRSRQRKTRFNDADDSKEYKWGKTEIKKEGDNNKGEKEKPNFGLSGKLTADANTVNGVVVKYTEPDDAKQPKRRWRFYPFKGDKALPILYIHRQSAFLIGRDKKVADIMLEHPSISKQHAALQFRATPFTRTDGTQGRRVRPYIIDLESANGTFVNNKKIEPRRYVELLERDVVKYGFSQREYVLLHENSKDDAQDDDHQDPPPLGANVTTTDQIKHEKRIKQENAADGD